jgi:hypothetical protein
VDWQDVLPYLITRGMFVGVTAWRDCGISLHIAHKFASVIDSAVNGCIVRRVQRR